MLLDDATSWKSGSERATRRNRVQRRVKGTRKDLDESRCWGLTLIQRFSFHQLLTWSEVWGQSSGEIKGIKAFLVCFFLFLLFFYTFVFGPGKSLDSVNERMEVWSYLLSEDCREVERTVEVLMTSSSTWWFWGSRSEVLAWHRCRTGKTKTAEMKT